VARIIPHDFLLSIEHLRRIIPYITICRESASAHRAEVHDVVTLERHARIPQAGLAGL
jgi:hypothetical protein